jgi:phospholipid transport system substrate-binding protein
MTTDLTRRSLLALATAGAVVIAASPFSRAFAQGAPDVQAARQFVERTGDSLVSIINGPGSLAEKQQRMQPLINGAVDVNGVGRFCLGRFWRLANPQQQQEYLQLFHSVLLNSITAKLGEYQGVRFSVGRADAREEGVNVTTTVIRPNNPPNTVIWVIADVGGSPKIEDVIAEGTSLRLTQRDDYASYLTRNNNDIQALIDALRRQVAQG